MTSEQRQFFAACLSAALFLGAVLSSVDLRVVTNPKQIEVALR
jgi:hypothetical protein